MTSSSRKITYSVDFKLKVLDYYLRNGGDEIFGLKKKTACHFNIDKKTINRLLNNPEMMRRVRKITPSTSTKRVSSSSKPSSSSRASKTSGRHIRSSKSSGGNYSSGNRNLSGTSERGMSVSSAGGGGTGGGASSTSTGLGTPSSSASAASSSSRGGVKVMELPEDPDYSLLKRSIAASANGVANVAKLLVTGTEEVRKLILNECDVILECKVCQNLFRSVVNFLAHKRIYCQEEFTNVRTLFHRDNTHGLTTQSGTVVVEPQPAPASPLSFLPSQQPRPLSGKGSGGRAGGIDTIAARLSGRKGGESATGRNGRGAEAGRPSHSTHTGSASYYERLQVVNQARDKLSQDCSVVLEDIRGVTNARLQTFLPHNASNTTTTATTTSATATSTATTTTTKLPHMSQLLEEVSQRASGISVVLGEHGQIVHTARGDLENLESIADHHHSQQETAKSYIKPVEGGTSLENMCRLCNTRFATAKTLSVHQRTQHGLERLRYPCPVCHASFTTMGSIIKHLERTHKKSKHQIDRLKKVIRKNISKKLLLRKSQIAVKEKKEEEEEEKKLKDKREERIRGREKRAEEELAATSEGSSSRSRSATTTTTTTPTSTTTSTTTRKSAMSKYISKREEGRTSGGGSAPEHRCGKCERRFMTPQALISHEKFCSLQQMKPQPAILPRSPLNPRLRSETPEKRIAIQIRKDYKKSLISSSPGCGEGALGVKEEGQEGSASTVEGLMGQICNLSNLTCVPCGRRYQTITTLKRHVAVHFNWTRYACCRCAFRSYNRYELLRHAITQHDMTEDAAPDLLVEDVAFGPIKYFLTPEDDKTEASEIEGGDADATTTPPPTTIKQEMNGTVIKIEKDRNTTGKTTDHYTDTQESGLTGENSPDNPLPPHPPTLMNGILEGVKTGNTGQERMESNGMVGSGMEGSHVDSKRKREEQTEQGEEQARSTHRSDRRKATKTRRINRLEREKTPPRTTCNGTHSSDTNLKPPPPPPPQPPQPPPLNGTESEKNQSSTTQPPPQSPSLPHTEPKNEKSMNDKLGDEKVDCGGGSSKGMVVNDSITTTNNCSNSGSSGSNANDSGS